MDRYITLDEVVAGAESITGSMTSTEKRLARQWAFDSLPYLGISDDEIEVCVLKPRNLVAKKPDDFRVLIALSLFDQDVSSVDPSTCNELPHLFRTGKKRINQTKEYPKISSDRGCQDLIDVSEDRRHIILGTNGKNVKSIMIRYFSYPLDDKGQPMFRNDDKLAVEMFIKWRWAMRRDENQSQIEGYWRKFATYADLALARSKSIHGEQAKATMYKFVSLIPNFNQEEF